MIPNPKTFLLQKIIDHRTNGLNSLGELHAKHVDDITEMLREFAEMASRDIIERIAKKELKIKVVK